jgi:AcrR family transcriptional regulator
MAVGLRELKKVATKQALSRAALELAIERGLDHCTAVAIADRAGISVRTFHNYFSSREDAVLFVVEQSVANLIALFIDRDPAEPVLDSFEALFMELVASEGEFDRMFAVTRLMTEHASLVAHQVAVYEYTSDALLAEIGRRTGCDPAVDLYPRLAFQCANAVVRAAVELHATSGPLSAEARISLTSSVRDGFAQLRGGLPQAEFHDARGRHPS